MPLFGTLDSMPLPDLLQWLCNAGVTGTLQLERNHVSKAIHLKNGMVVGCSSNDPPQRLGHFLLNRGKINEEQLREALQLQEISGQHLGMLLVELNAISPDELTVHLEAQAEETIYSLFDWTEAVFRFQENENDPANVFPVSLRVEDVLLRGLKRYDEMQEIRSVFNDTGIVLVTIGDEPPAAVRDNRMGRTIWELVNGERTVAEILLQVHGSEYVVTKFLFELHRSGLVRVDRIKPILKPERPAASSAAANDEPGESVPGPADGSVTSAPPEFEAFAPTQPLVAAAPSPTKPVTQAAVARADVAPIEDLLSGFNPEIDLPAIDPAAIEPLQSEPDTMAEKGVEALQDSDAHSLERRLEQARKLMSASDFEEALELLDRLYREFPGDDSLRRLTAEAEAAFVEKAYRHYLPPSKVLVLLREMDSLEAEDLTPSEFYLLSRIDGSWDIKSIIQIAPLRESDALRTLKRMRENQLIDLRDPD